MPVSSSFSTPYYCDRSSNFLHDNGNRGCCGQYSRSQSLPTFTPTKLRNRYGNVIHCSFCNFWFHLIQDCLERKHTVAHYVDDTKIGDRLHTEFLRDQSVFELEHPVHEYNLSSSQDYGEQEHDEYLFFYSLTTENTNSGAAHGFHMHESAAISPTLNEVLKRHPNLNPNLNLKFNGICFDEGAP